MNISAGIAQVFGIVLAVMGLSVILDRTVVSAAVARLTEDRGFLWMWSFLLLSLGATIVVMNHAWTPGLPFLITVLGWLTLLKGTLLLLIPGPAAAFYRQCNNKGVLLFGGITGLVLGLVLLYLSL